MKNPPSFSRYQVTLLAVFTPLMATAWGCSDDATEPGTDQTMVTAEPTGPASPTLGAPTGVGTTPTTPTTPPTSMTPSATPVIPPAVTSGGGTGGSPSPQFPTPTASGGAASGGDGAGAPSAGAGGTGAGGTVAGQAGAGNGGSAGEADSGIPASLETVELVIMALGCNGSDCHGGNEFNPLDLRLNDELYSNLTTSVSEKCEGLPIVDPGNPEGSALIRILKGPCGEIPQMPAGCIPGEGGGCVPDDYVAAIEQWVADGAPEE